MKNDVAVSMTFAAKEPVRALTFMASDHKGKDAPRSHLLTSIKRGTVPICESLVGDPGGKDRPRLFRCGRL